MVGYIEIAAKNNKHICNEEQHEYIIIKNTKTNKTFKVKIPQIIFSR